MQFVWILGGLFLMSLLIAPAVGLHLRKRREYEDYWLSVYSQHIWQKEDR